ncbi:unnamed protein product [Soboliphyme baturini]|uniref:Major sperm protein n=1 Tax=Soboliphyme baturini TaxID=241478 RepID=A0A183JBC8_9BILA|nr:unnamed protein product [Soboliphyme baturini]
MCTHGDIRTEPAENIYFNVPCASDQTCVIRLTNISSRRIAYSVQMWTDTQENIPGRHYTIKPPNGVLSPYHKVLVHVSVDPFQFETNKMLQDKVVIKYFEAPREGDVYSDQWTLTAPVIHQKLMPVFYNW